MQYEIILEHLVETYIKHRYPFFRIDKYKKWKSKPHKRNTKKNGLYMVVENVYELADVVFRKADKLFTDDDIVIKAKKAIVLMEKYIRDYGWVYPTKSNITELIRKIENY